MKKRIYFIATALFWSMLFMNSTKADAQLFGADDESLNKVFNELKKINSRLIAIETSESGILGSHLEEVQRQIKEIKQAIPQSSIGEVINQINAQNKRLEDTNYIFKSELIPAIQKDMKGLKEGLAKDMETFADKNQVLNQKLVEILEENLKQNMRYQEEIKEMLTIIRQKANINISRNDDIKKALEKSSKGQ